MSYARDLSSEEYIRRASVIHATFDSMMESDPVGFGERFYKTLLRDEPDIAELFEGTKIQTQAVKFITMVRHTVNLLDDHRTFRFKMVELGRTHDTYGVKLPMLSSFGEALTRTLKAEAVFEGKWTDGMTSDWAWFWKVVESLFTEGILERRKEIEEKKEYKPRTILPVIDPVKDVTAADVDDVDLEPIPVKESAGKFAEVTGADADAAAAGAASTSSSSSS